MRGLRVHISGSASAIGTRSSSTTKKTMTGLTAGIVMLMTAILFTAWPVMAEGETTDPPAKPTGLTGTITHSAVSLTWDDPQDKGDGGDVLKRQVITLVTVSVGKLVI